MVTTENGTSWWNDLNCDAHQDWICMIAKGKKPIIPPLPPSPEPGASAFAVTREITVSVLRDSAEKFRKLNAITFPNSEKIANNTCRVRISAFINVVFLQLLSADQTLAGGRTTASVITIMTQISWTFTWPL